MKTIDDFIRENPGRFDLEQPPEGHLERFDSRLSVFVQRRQHHRRNLFLRVAAIFLLGAVITYAAIREFGTIINGNGNGYNTASAVELNEAELFYTKQLGIYYDKIQNLRFNNDATEKKKVLDELSEMDKQVQTMKQDLKQNPDDERVVHAIINFYQLKIEMMDMIIDRAQQTTNTIL
jgi:hypothetical protein